MGPLGTPSAQAAQQAAQASDPAVSTILPDAPQHRYPIHIGIDVGQVHDPTAIVVVEVMQRPTGRTRAVTRHSDPRRVQLIHGQTYVEHITETVYLARHIERVQLQTRYPEVAKRVAEIVCAPLLAGRERRVFIDQTGVGRPIVELVTDAIFAHPDADARNGGSITMRPITFTSGMDYDAATGKMGKAYLVSRLQALSQADPVRVIVPEGHREAAAMLRELKDYSLKVSQDGADTYGALKIGQYDDLATALGLAVLEDPNDYEVGWIPFQAIGW
jgi:hypothetical protein